MSKRQLDGKKAMTQIKNTLSKCFCGSYFDQDSICANGHLQDGEYSFPGMDLNKKTAEKKESLSEQGICIPFGCRCNICGAYFPEGDNICDSGHIIGVKYSNN